MPIMLDGNPAGACTPAKNGRGLPVERVMLVQVDTKGMLSIQHEAPAIPALHVASQISRPW